MKAKKIASKILRDFGVKVPGLSRVSPNDFPGTSLAVDCRALQRFPGSFPEVSQTSPEVSQTSPEVFRIEGTKTCNRKSLRFSVASVPVTSQAAMGTLLSSKKRKRNKGGRKQMRANANKRRQTQANAEAKTQANANKRKQTWTNANKRLEKV